MPKGIYKRTNIITEKTRQKLRQNCLKGITGMLGKKHSEESKLKMSLAAIGRKGLVGENNWHWKGGRHKTLEGYILVLDKNNPSSNAEGRIMEHRKVMEEFLGRRLEKWEIVHHKNGIKDDNRLENLDIVINKKHFGVVRCPYCTKDFLIK